MRRHRLSHRCWHRAGHGGLAPAGWAGGQRSRRGSPHSPGLGPGHQPLPRHTGTPGPARLQRWNGARAMLAKRGAVPMPMSPTCPPQAGTGGTPGPVMPGPHGTASPRVGTVGGCQAGGGSPHPCGEQVCGRAPQPPRPPGPQLGQSRGLFRGRAGTEGQSWRHSGTEQRGHVSPIISPQMAVAGPWLRPSPGAGQRGNCPSSSGMAAQPWASFFSLGVFFFFPSPVENNI